MGLLLVRLALATLMGVCIFGPQFTLIASAQLQLNGKANVQALMGALQRGRAPNTYVNFLRLLRISGYQAILANYITRQPVTILAPTDAAFRKLSLRVRRQLTGPKLVKLIQFHLIFEKFPYDFFKQAKAGGLFRTVYGWKLVKMANTPAGIILKPQFGTVASQARVLPGQADLTNVNAWYLLAVEGIDTVLIPPRVFV